MDLKASICHLEMKNRKLNETVDKAIYGKTSGVMNKTSDALRRRSGDGQNDRLNALMETKPLTAENALKELESKKKQAEMMSSSANARNPYNDPARSSAAVVENLEKLNNTY